MKRGEKSSWYLNGTMSIRSAWFHFTGLVSVTEGGAASDFSGHRITSYNVCYTKLLRINLNRQTITLGDSLSLNAAGLCLPTGDAATGESNITTGYAACGGYEPLTVGGLDLGPAA